MKRGHHHGNIRNYYSTFHVVVHMVVGYILDEMALWFNGSRILFQHGHGSAHPADAIVLSGYLTGVGVYYPQPFYRTLLNILVAFSAGRRIIVVRIMVRYDYILVMFICWSDLSLNLATLKEMVNRWYAPNVRTQTQPNAAITVCCGMLFLCPKCLPSFNWMMDYNFCLGRCVYLGMWWNIELKILKGWSVLYNEWLSLQIQI